MNNFADAKTTKEKFDLIKTNLSDILNTFSKEKIIISLENELENNQSLKDIYKKLVDLQLLDENKKIKNSTKKIKHVSVLDHGEQIEFELDYPEIFHTLDTANLRKIYEHIFKLTDPKWKSSIVQFLKNNKSFLTIPPELKDEFNKILTKKEENLQKQNLVQNTGKFNADKNQ